MRMDPSSSQHQARKNPFEGIAPCSLSDAPLQSQVYPAYDVFINHRGPDVKNTLAALIRKHLAAFNLRVFLDQYELQPGDFLPAAIQHALDTSSVHLAIFSPNYAESPWCLAELSHMLTTRATIIPIFYDVEPSHVRYITGPYAPAFRNHEEKQRIDPQIVQQWKDDLCKVSLISGIVFSTTKDDEAILLKKVVQRVVEKSRGEVLDVAKHPVGLDEALEAFQTTLSESNEQYSDNAMVVGIVGMGGIGKTTLAKKIYNQRSWEYKGCCCFLSDVRLEASNNGLTSLQSKLLQKLDWKTDSKIDSISQGIEIMRNRLQNKKVLLVLDDVDKVDQIDALLVKGVLGPGSSVILTSRDKGVLLSSGVTIFHQVKDLRESPARELFCWHAFLLPSPSKEFEALVDMFLMACSGLPLSLKVIGALLYKKDLPYWNGTLEKIGKRILPGTIIDALKVTFEALDREEKETFLDIACFFAGEVKSKLIRIWDGSGWSGMQCLENLEQKCLVEFSHQYQDKRYTNRGEDGVLVRMHDHLRDMGRSVVDNQSQPSRLWRADDIDNYLWRIQHRMVTEVRGIWGYLAPQSTRNNCGLQLLEICGGSGRPWSSSSAVAARPLKLLQAQGDSIFTEFNSSLLRNLLWLRWDGCCCANALSRLCVPNLRVLELVDVDCDLDTLWRDHNQVPKQLRELNIKIVSGLKFLAKSTGLLRNLEKIVLLNGSMKTVPDELCQLQLLSHLDLRFCERLELLPSSFGDLRNLRHLDLTGCWGLQALPNSFSQLIQLQYLSLYNCEKLMVSTDILRNIVTLEYLKLTYCIPETLPIHITNQRLLRNLYVRCHHLKELPADMENLFNLRVLEVESETMIELPSSLKSLSLPESLEYLKLKNIQVLPQGLAHLKNLVELVVENSPLGDIMFSNPRDEERPSALGNRLLTDSLAKAMVRLEYIDLINTKTTKLCIATDVCPNLKTLQIMNCMCLIQVEALPITLEFLSISCCKCLIQVEALPITLVTLLLYGCEKLKNLEGLHNLTRLRYFNIIGCFELQELEDLSELRSLESLRAEGSWMLAKMEGLQQLQQLEVVEISACTAGVWKGIECLKELPSNACDITLGMQTVGGEESQMYRILNSLGFPISVLDLQIGASCKLEVPEGRSCSGLIVIVLCESSGERASGAMECNLEVDNNSCGKCVPVLSGCQCIILSMYTEESRFFRPLKIDKIAVNGRLSVRMRNSAGIEFSNTKGWVVLLKDREEWKMREIWEKLFRYAYSKKAF